MRQPLPDSQIAGRQGFVVIDEFAFVPRRPIVSQRHAVLYRHGQANQCPACGASAWFVGRHSAQCASCAEAIPLHQPFPTERTV